jgi:fibro-slime domain-containing protein
MNPIMFQHPRFVHDDDNQNYSLGLDLRRDLNKVARMSLRFMILGAGLSTGLVAGVPMPITPSELELPVTFRDFDVGPPDIEFLPCSQHLEKNVILPYLDADRKPIINPDGPCPEFNVSAWFRDQPGALHYCRQLPMRRIPGSEAIYFFQDAHFFPLDDIGTQRFIADDGLPHNFHFSMEMHLSFLYRGGEIFSYLGDDEIFLFVNNRLAVDLGGNHGPLPDVLDMDAMSAKLGLVPGNYYSFDLFFCERHTVTSYLKMHTNIDFLPAPPGGIHISDAGLSLVKDTVAIYQSEPAAKFYSVRIQNQEQMNTCASTPFQARLPALGKWSLASQALGTDSLIMVDPNMHPLGVYLLKVDGSDSRDSIWIKIALPRVAAPQPSPRGGVNCDLWNIKLVTETPLAEIFFTTGTEPYSSGKWVRYLGSPIALTGDQVTLRSVAVKSGFSDSPILRETYLRDQTFAPSIKPPGQIAPVFPFKISLSSLSNKATLLYRILLNDDPPGQVIPDTVWQTYTASFMLPQNALVKAKATKEGCRTSDQSEETYGMARTPTPTIDPKLPEFWPSLTTVHIQSPGSSDGLFFGIDSTFAEESQAVWKPYAGQFFSLGHSSLVRAIATRPGFQNSEPSEAFFSRASLQGSGKYLDRDGDGRIESAVMAFNFPLPYAPALRLRDPISGASTKTDAILATTLPANASANGNLLSLRFPPFTFGTSFVSGPYGEILSDSLFTSTPIVMGDSVGPVLVSAECQPALTGGGTSKLRLVFSEPVAPIAMGLFPFEIARQGKALLPALVGPSQVTLDGIGSTYRFAIDSAYPCRGDSIRAKPLALRDNYANSGAMNYNIPITGDRPVQHASIGILTIRENPVRLQSLVPIPNLPVAILVNPQGEALDKSLAGLANLPGPEFSFRAKYQVDRISLACFDNLGVFVSRLDLRLTDEQWRAIRNYSSSDNVSIHIKWIPVSNGQLLGTGVYIIKGTLTARQGLVRGNNDEELSQTGTIRFLSPLRFGIIR